MKNTNIRSSSVFTYMFCIVLSGLFYSSATLANTDQLAGKQLAFFVGYHSGGMQKSNPYRYVYSKPRSIYYSPRYHHKRSYKTSWTHTGHNCRKTCWLDRWTGKALRCYTTC